MKNKLLLGLISTGILLASTNAYALSGNATVEFTSENNIKVGDTFTVRMNVNNVTDTYDGIVSLGGNLVFDKDMIEYVSTNEIKTPYEFYINEDYNYKLAGLDFTLDKGILENTTVYEFTFKALQEGNTTITLENYKLTDSKDYVNTTVVAKNIVIDAKEEIVEEVKPVVTEVKEVKVEKVEKNIETVKPVEEKEETTEKVKEVVIEKVEEKNEIVEEKQEEVKETVITKIATAITNFFKNFSKLFK